MSKPQRTVFYDRHVALGVKMLEFDGWEMSLWYSGGIVEEHLATRKGGLFDVSHMGRFMVRGAGAVKFLQHILTNNAEALNIREKGGQYTVIPNETGGAGDDAFLYHFLEDEYLVVVNAANRQKDWEHPQSVLKDFDDVELTDRTREIGMIALQGPMSRDLLGEIIQSGPPPEPM